MYILVKKQFNYRYIQKGAYYSGIQIFNHLPQGIKSLSDNVTKFKAALKEFLLLGSFYTLNEYLDWNSRSELGFLA
jgi:hypothetical protein